MTTMKVNISDYHWYDELSSQNESINLAALININGCRLTELMLSKFATVMKSDEYYGCVLDN